MPEQIDSDIWVPEGCPRRAADREALASTIGRKACGLTLIPPSWTPPFVVLTTSFYKRWLASNPPERATLAQLAGKSILDWLSAYAVHWKHGLWLRSSSTQESLLERGQYLSIDLAADADAQSVARAIIDVFDQFIGSQARGEMAIVAQARASCLVTGHCSNEQRVSKTINQWDGEAGGTRARFRFNSQRATPRPSTSSIRCLAIDERSIHSAIRSFARYCTELEEGRTHFEWGVGEATLWIFQLDFEDDAPDVGVDPDEYFRESDIASVGLAPEGSILQACKPGSITGWPKVDKTEQFFRGREGRKPTLHIVTGDKLDACDAVALEKLQADIECVTNGRAVCRSDINSSTINKLNLPRTDTVSSAAVVLFMSSTLSVLRSHGVQARDICFIIHKFIPARSAAWVLAKPSSQIVRVDTLWGLPDGLQYLAHDTFEFDVLRDMESAEHTRYKSTFLQEQAGGQWQLVKVKRNAARRRSVSAIDVADIAKHSHSVALALGRPILLMWFCEIDSRLEMGRNVPWFMMDAHDPSIGTNPAPTLRRIEIRSALDLAALSDLGEGEAVLRLVPDLEVFRDAEFLSAVSKFAVARKIPVELEGSSLAHAFYILERAGVTVVSGGPPRARKRQRRSFLKIVRDAIPESIKKKGERVEVAHIVRADARRALVVKLLEEAWELTSARTASETTEELADLFEVLRSLAATTGSTWDDVVTVAERKRERRGGFDESVVLIETSWPSLRDKLVEGRITEVTLRDLARITVDRDGNVCASFAAIVGGTGPIDLGGASHISLQMVRDGVKVVLHQIESPNPDDGQLRFDL